jgi:hypothetical protein
MSSWDACKVSRIYHQRLIFDVLHCCFHQGSSPFAGSNPAGELEEAKLEFKTMQSRDEAGSSTNN